MTRDAKTILKEALRLPAASRAELVEHLQVSLSEGIDPAVDAAWAKEIERRVKAIESAAVKPIPGSEVRKKLWRRLRADRRR